MTSDKKAKSVLNPEGTSHVARGGQLCVVSYSESPSLITEPQFFSKAVPVIRWDCWGWAMTMRFYKAIGAGLGCRLSHEHHAWDFKWCSQGERELFSPSGIEPGFLTRPPVPHVARERERSTEKKQS